MRKDIIWSISLGFSFLIWLLIPELRMVFTCVLLLHAVILYIGIRYLNVNFFCKSLCYKGDAGKKLALTFDDGPDPECTPQILDLLDTFNFKATFFIVATKALSNPAICKDILNRGHTIACHDLTHSYKSNFRLSTQMISDIGKAQTIIQSITGLTPRFYRPPVGLSNPHLAKALDKLNMICIGWNRSVSDAGNRRLKTFSRFKSLPSNGAVILLHDVLPVKEYKKAFFTELELLFETIRINKFEAVTIDKLFSEKPYL